MQIRVLGEVELWRDGRRVESLVGKQQALLSTLLTAPGFSVSQDFLIEQLWPESDPEAATAALHSCIYRVRKAIASDAVRLRRDARRYQLELAPDVVDLQRFEALTEAGRAALDRGDYQSAAGQLRTALDLWRGESFAGVDLPSVRDRARSVDETRLDVAEWWLSAELALGHNEEVGREAAVLITRNPLRERLWELELLALYRAGRQTVALERYGELRRLLADELGIDPSPSVQELHQRILAGTEDLRHEPSDRSTGRAPAVVPRQLPAGVGRFVGRATLLEELTRLSDRPRVTEPLLAVITGPAGMGKTTFAVHWAHTVAGDYPDGQLYVNLQGFDPSGRVRTVGEVARGYLVGLGVPADEVPAEVDDQLALFRTITADRELLIILDNARDAEQVRPLLPSGPGCCVVITSRDQLAGLVATEGAWTLPLLLLEEAECEELLVGRIGAERVAADRQSMSKIIESCGRLPLALAIAAARVSSRPRLSLAGAVASLFDPRRSLDALNAGSAAGDLRQVFSWSYTTLEPEAARLFRLLGVHPGPEIGAGAVASLIGRPAAEVPGLLDRLIAANLITEHEPGRYQLHDLLRRYAAELADRVEGPVDCRQAELRVLDHHLRTAARSVALDDPSRPPIDLPPPEPDVTPEELDRNGLLQWCRVEHTVLTAVVRRGMELGADQAVYGLVWAIRTYLATINPPLPDLPFSRAALTAAQRMGDSAAELGARSYLMYDLANLGRLDDALQEAGIAGELAAELDRPRERGVVLIAAGHVHSSKTGDKSDELPYNREALYWFRKAGYTRGVAFALNALGESELARGNGAAALQHCLEAVETYADEGDDAGLGDLVDTLAAAYGTIGDLDLAVTTFERAIELYHTAGFHRAAGDSWDRLAGFYEAAGRSADGLHALRQALAIYQESAPDRADAVRRRMVTAATVRRLDDRNRAS
ncbi:BTAD domain-containing putative transcriptional regulator [Microlunatus sp. GCM10028923]|uniref:AfsR/SARP family transcriptional regulator n=1 Tax=Microlunatus sp. GCM10028923 TaxID=3273400 RepID=UPI0036238DAE